MSNTRFVGAYPDHVTRYNHKDESRWLVQTKAPQTRSLAGLVDGVICALSGAGLITAAVFILQAV